jgi:hypothetical protein
MRGGPAEGAWEIYRGEQEVSAHCGRIRRPADQGHVHNHFFEAREEAMSCQKMRVEVVLEQRECQHLPMSQVRTQLAVVYGLHSSHASVIPLLR